MRVVGAGRQQNDLRVEAGRRRDLAHRLDQLRTVIVEPAQGDTEAFTIADPDRVWTVREIAKHAAVGGRGPIVVGPSEDVAEELIAWVEDTDVDGCNLA